MDINNRYVYENIDEIPVYNFFKCCEGKYNYMYNDRKGEVNDDVIDTFKKLHDKYCALTISNKTLKYYRLIGEVEYMEKKLIFMPVLVNLLIKTPVKSNTPIIKEIKNWGYKINNDKELKPQLENITQRLNNLKTKLKRTNDELTQLNEGNGENISLPKQVAKLKSILKGVSVDIYRDSVATWVAYWDQVEELNKRSNE